MSWLKELRDQLFRFHREPQRIPVPGEQWELTDPDNNGDPFPPKHRVVAKILDVRKNWVRYYQNDSFPDERMPLAMFAAIYVPINPEESVNEAS